MAQTTTERGRAKLVTPDLGYDAEIDGGVALAGVINALWAQIGDALGVRWSGSVTVANGNFVDIAHNFASASTNLTVRFTKADGSRYTKFESDTAFTITYTDANNLRVTNASGGSLTFTVTVLPYGLGIRDADFDELAFGGQSDDVILNKDAGASGADWRATIRRPSSGMAAAAVHTLPLLTGILAQTNVAQVFTALQTLGQTAFSSEVDSTTTGTNGQVPQAGAGPAPAASVVELTNASLTGIAGVLPPSPGDYRLVFLVNNRGGTITIRNQSGSAPGGGGILTGSGADIDLVAGGVLPLLYSPNASLWVVFGGGGGGAGASQAINQTSHGFTVGQWLYRQTSGGYALAQSDGTRQEATAVGRVSQVTDTNNFVLQTAGFFTSASLFAQGLEHFVASTAGAFATATPTNAAHWTKKLFTALTDSLAFIDFGELHASGVIVGTDGTQTVSNKTNLAAAGSASAPTHSFVDEATMGFYRSASGTTAWGVGSALRLTMATSLFTWSGGRLDVVAQGSDLAEVRVTTAAAATSRFIIAASGNQGVTGSTIGDTVFLGNASNSFLWSTDGTTILASLSTKLSSFVVFRWSNVTSNPGTRAAGDSWYRSDETSFRGAVGGNDADLGHFVLMRVRGTFSFGSGDSMSGSVGTLLHEIFPVKSNTSAGNVLGAAVLFGTATPPEGKVMELIGAHATDTVTIQDSRGSAKGLVLTGGDWTSNLYASIKLRYISALDRFIEIGRTN